MAHHELKLSTIPHLHSQRLTCLNTRWALHCHRRSLQSLLLLLLLLLLLVVVVLFYLMLWLVFV